MNAQCMYPAYSLGFFIRICISKPNSCGRLPLCTEKNSSHWCSSTCACNVYVFTSSCAVSSIIRFISSASTIYSVCVCVCVCVCVWKDDYCYSGHGPDQYLYLCRQSDATRYVKKLRKTSHISENQSQRAQSGKDG